jgi:hypothetical protein
MIYLYDMQAFALAIIVHYTAPEIARWLYRKLIAVSMLGVFVDTSQTPGAFNPSPAPIPSRFSGVLERLAKAPYSYTATQPQI